MNAVTDARTGAELRRTIAAALIDMARDAFVAEDPRRAAQGEPGLTADVTVNAVRILIGQAVSRFPPGPDRQDLKSLLAQGLGQPVGQLLGALSHHQALAAIEGHGALRDLALFGSGRPNLSTPEASASHLKVVK